MIILLLLIIEGHKNGLRTHKIPTITERDANRDTSIPKGTQKGHIPRNGDFNMTYKITNRISWDVCPSGVFGDRDPQFP